MPALRYNSILNRAMAMISGLVPIHLECPGQQVGRIMRYLPSDYSSFRADTGSKWAIFCAGM